jgi:uncharacterized repeat protein (TIGR03803 family)
MNRKTILLPTARSKLNVMSIIASLMGAASPALAQHTLTTLANFNFYNGANPLGGLTIVGGTLYGTAEGGVNGYGVVFSVPITGGTPTALAAFNSSNGVSPAGTLAVVGNSLYGTTADGGPNFYDHGTVFSLPISGGTPTVLAAFDGNNGYYPNELTLIGSTFYGTTVNGQGMPTADGTVFSLPISGGETTTLATFNSSDGANPNAGLTIVGNTLYGTTQYGGANDDGTVFSVPISGGTPTILATFNGSNGAYLDSGLTLVGSTLYGITKTGGAYGDGTVFSLPISGGSPTTLATFNNNNGAFPRAGLTVVGSTLYGTTAAGGANGDGTVFSLPITGGSPITLVDFNGTNGANPGTGCLIADGSGNFYGTTVSGGANDNGTVFELSVPEPTSLSLLALGSLSLLARKRRSTP